MLRTPEASTIQTSINQSGRQQLIWEQGDHRDHASYASLPGSPWGRHQRSPPWLPCSLAAVPRMAWIPQRSAQSLGALAELYPQQMHWDESAQASVGPTAKEHCHNHRRSASLQDLSPPTCSSSHYTTPARTPLSAEQEACAFSPSLFSSRAGQQ